MRLAEPVSLYYQLTFGERSQSSLLHSKFLARQIEYYYILLHQKTIVKEKLIKTKHSMVAKILHILSLLKWYRKLTSVNIISDSISMTEASLLKPSKEKVSRIKKVGWNIAAHS